MPAGAGRGYRAGDSPFRGAFEQGRSDGCGEGPLRRGQEGLAAGISWRSALVSILRRRRWVQQGTLWGFRADLGGNRQGWSSAMIATGCLGQAGSETLPAPETPPGPLLLEPPPRGVWGIHSWWGTFSAGPTAWLTPSWLSMLGFELSLPRCGGVWAAQCLNSLMTMLGCCPCPARPP